MSPRIHDPRPTRVRLRESAAPPGGGAVLAAIDVCGARLVSPAVAAPPTLASSTGGVAASLPDPCGALASVTRHLQLVVKDGAIRDGIGGTTLRRGTSSPPTGGTCVLDQRDRRLMKGETDGKS
jgi:hypothetical protein